ncbi:hypothetical protein HOLleu_08272 [Holothuria leucospilota]|uniref:Uncharacterized protein n=1 Tax=Holothuria leucospilota TaxID=206669 RepID=A0A9Q1CI02_HOLLE|nr:hypothetical protein HOLleu_08272 [Holothuria leucospilota]
MKILSRRISVFYFNLVFAIFTVTNISTSSSWSTEKVAKMTNNFHLSLVVNRDGTYSLSGWGIPTLYGADTVFTINNTQFSRQNGTLRPISGDQFRGMDPVLGSYLQVDLTWSTTELNPVQIITTFKLFDHFPAVIFSQNFSLGGLRNTSIGDENGLSTIFPSFTFKGEEGDTGFLSYGQGFLKNVIAGRWGDSGHKINTGLQGGPLALFSSGGSTVVISPSSQFMAASMTYQNEDQSINCGIMGKVKEVPQDFTMETVLYFGEGVKNTFESWGKFLLTKYQTNRHTDADMTLRYLGYWTDNGAAYYYMTELFKNYEETMFDIKQDADKNSMPYSVVQKTLGTPLAAHNRYWSPDNVYAKENGGKYDFIIEESIAIPNDTNFWCDFFKNISNANWKLRLYEQDWLNYQFLNMEVTKEDIHLGRDWLIGMGECAAVNNIVILYSMPLARHVLQSVEIPAVTQVRASGDFLHTPHQWDIGFTSILHHALGLIPFKDTFRSSGNQEITPFPVQLHTIAAVLSQGTVGPGDKIGYSNIASLKGTCRSDGLLLRPSRPAMVIEEYILQKAAGKVDSPLIWSTYSEISGFTFGIILAIDVNGSVEITPNQVDLGMLPANQFAFFYNSTKSFQFDYQTPIRIGPNTVDSVSLIYTSPSFKLKNETFMLYGETSKYVPVSPDRIKSITLLDTSITFILDIASNEKVVLTMKTFAGAGIFYVTCPPTVTGGLVMVQVYGLNSWQCFTA